MDLQNDIERVNSRLDSFGLPAANSLGSVIVPRLKRPLDSPIRVRETIEHTLLKPDAEPSQIEDLCSQASQYGLYGVCVHPVYVEMASRLLKKTSCAVVSVIGFPHGATLSKVKAAEAREVVQLGADELDMVISIGLLKAGEYRAVYEDIRYVVEASKGKPVKVIIETALLSIVEKIAASMIVARSEASFVKTSSGFAGGGATVEDVALLRKVVPEHVGVKAAGGIRDLKTALAMIEAGADRLGCSSSVAIMAEAMNYAPDKRA